MTIRATAGFNFLRHDPGNPEFPTLPDGVITPHVLTYQTGGGDKRTRQAYSSRTKFIAASAPADDSQRFAGWQTETTWINPTTVDFGVIPSPVQRTVSLYNARTVPIEVTALSLPTGVTLISPSLPVTLTPYDGVTFIIEAGITGDNAFDETSTFTTSVGDSSFRTLGRRVFTLNAVPQAPMSETLQFRTDLLRSTDGTEKAYSLLQAPNAMVDYKVFFTDDLQRIRFKNNFIAGESALVVAGQKWYEARILRTTAQATDTSLDLTTNAFDASWVSGGPISVVTEDGTTVEAVLDSTEDYPDPNINLNTLVLRFDGANGSQTTGDDGPLDLGDLTWSAGGNPEISTTQSKWGGSSFFSGTTFPSFTFTGADIGETMPYFEDDDWTIDFWVYPIAFYGCPLSRWKTSAGPGREWRIILSSTQLQLTFADPALTTNFVWGSPREYLSGQWNYVRIARVGNDIRVFMNGIQIGATLNLVGSINLSGTGPLPVSVGNYYDSGFVVPYNGYVDDVRITIGLGRSIANFTPPTAPHAILEDQNLRLNLSDQIGTLIPAGSRVMPIGLGYVSRFPTYSTYQDNLETADYTLTFNQEADFGALDPSFTTLSNALLSPVVETPILEACNEIGGRAKRSQLQRYEDRLESGLSNRQAFTVFPFSDTTQEYMITLNSEAEVWKWRTFIQYLRGSYNDFYVPTFTDDIPGVTTAASNVFTAQDTDLALLFGTTPADRRNAIRLEYPDGTILYRIITAVVDNGATEQITVSSAVNVGNPKISYLQRARILGDTVSFTHNRTDYVTLRFRYRTLTE